MKAKKKKSFKNKTGNIKRLEYDYHLPVFKTQAVDWLINKTDGVYVDGTLGGGGHSEEILKKLSDLGELHSFDKDESAIDYCQLRFKEELNKSDNSRLIIHNECYSKACSILSGKGLDGILLDLGLSSRQLDKSRRGFSYRVDSPLDMRFSPQGKTAEDILHAAQEEEIADILHKYGEEPFAKRIARRIVEKRRAFSFKTTFDLKAVVIESVPKHLHLKSLSRVFQAFRIAVNDELKVLEITLNSCLPIFNNKARIVIISYHSLEDRIVKNFFKEHKLKKSNLKNNLSIDVPKLNILTTKPLVPENLEISQNPRARSAKMRVAEVLNKN